MNTFRKCRDALFSGPDLLGAFIMFLAIPVGAGCWSVIGWAVVEGLK